jgi:histidinol dehydrogenase
VRCERRFVPIRKVGLYVPGGSAPLPSTVVMLGTPAAIAGCEVRALATPPRPDGTIDPHILVAAKMLGITDIFKMGGAQAIAALAYGTRTVPRVDKIFGPGNSWVTEAKLQVARDPAGAACDIPAGPSEVMVIADGSANARFVAADLLAQAEHGPDSQVILVGSSRALVEEVAAELEAQLERTPRREIARKALARSVLILVDRLSDALDICNEYAPEHLILHVDDARRYAEGIRNAGSVFIGAFTPETAGDYASGTNHVLPTYGFARAFGGLTTESFLKSITFQEITPHALAELGPVLMRLAGIEGLEAHANAVRVRLESKTGDVGVLPARRVEGRKP